jgi:hypothetical protein
MEPSRTASREYPPRHDHADDRPHLEIPEELAAELADLAAETAPSRFAVCVVDDEQLDAAVIGWGLALTNGMLVYLPRSEVSGTGRTIRTFSSVEQMRRRLCRDANIGLLWIDPEPAPIPTYEQAETHAERPGTPGPPVAVGD